MSRSFKLPIYKDKGFKNYWRYIRSTINNKLRSQLYKDLDNLELPNPKTIIDDWDYCDYAFDYRKFLIKRGFKKLRNRRYKNPQVFCNISEYAKNLIRK